MKPDQPLWIDREVIRITRDGVWLADDSEITHEPTRKLFAKSLKKDSEGYYLSIGKEKKRIQVEDTAYFVTRIDGNFTEGYQLTLSDETQEKLNPLSLQYRPGRLTCSIKNNHEVAKFLHAAYFDLLLHLQEDQTHYFLEFEGPTQKIKIPLATKTESQTRPHSKIS